jgi:hypothetical protein
MSLPKPRVIGRSALRENVDIEIDYIAAVERRLAYTS